MNDRELLELAAKAASQPGGWIENEHEGWGFWQKPGGGEWNPPTDDSDALRLAVKLNLTILPGGRVLLPDAVGFCSPFGVAAGDDEVILAATRHAIVRAAAEIGRQMQEGGASMRCAYTKEEVRDALLKALTRIRALPVYEGAILMAHKYAEEAIAKAARGAA